jgi:hypothetical protein
MSEKSMKKKLLLCGAITAFLYTTVGAQVTPWLHWTFLADSTFGRILGESSGENAWHMIMETGGYDKDRPASEYETIFHETQFYLDKMREYNLPGAALVRFPGGETWDAVKGELWEISPGLQKLASYRDLAASLATGSTSAEVTAELVWADLGRKEDLEGKDVAGKIVVTEGPAGAVHAIACQEMGAAGVITSYSPNRYFDPLQLPWGNLRGGGNGPAKFAFQIPPREAQYLKSRLLAGEKITVRAEVLTETRKYDIQDLTCSIPGSDTTAGEVILTAHLFEGYVKQGGNDDISGCAAIMEVARTLNTLIGEGRIVRPRRTIRFLWAPEFSGTIPWVNANRAIMQKTLCNINLDMVGEWLSKNQSFMCLMRTSYANPHYVNDVVESYYRYVGEGNRERIQNRGNAYPVPHRIVSPTGADEPFYYSIETHYGASDHEVFNDWAIKVPGVLMIAWPDRWYHTSGDHVDKSDPTQLKRTVIIAAASAYTIAGADEEMATRIAGEILSNATRRLGYQMMRGQEKLNGAASADLQEAYSAARTYIEAALMNEKSTLATVRELAPASRQLASYLVSGGKSLDDLGGVLLESLRTHMEATARKLATSPASEKLSALEKKAQGLVPRPTARVKANGFYGYNKFIQELPQEVRERYPVDMRNLGDSGELQRLIDGRRNLLDIKKMVDAQSPSQANLQDVLNYLETLKAAGLVEY